MTDELVILIVDDIEINRMILKGIFDGDYQVLEADDGDTALDLLNGGQRVDLILLDVIMPRMNGIEFLSHIKRDSRFSDIPIVVNTQAGEQENEYRALELGADDFIVKPYNPKIVKRRITNIIEKYIYQKNVMKRTIKDTQNKMDNLIDTVPGGIGIFEVSEDIALTYFNDGLCFMLGYDRDEFEELTAGDIMQFVYDKDEDVLLNIMNKSMANTTIHCKVRLLRRDGTVLWTGISAKKLQDDDTKTKVYHVVFMDLTEEKEAETKIKNTMVELKYRAEMDTLTGLLNRETFYASAQELMHSNTNEKYVVGYWNIDRFKVINELFGSRTGDQILKNIANNIKDRTKKYGVCGRPEADHFVTCTSINFIENNMEQIEAFLTGEDTWNVLNYPVLLHVGFYIVEDVDTAVDLMCDRASMALQMIKGNYLKRWNYYNANLKNTILVEQELINEMDEALASHQFVVYYQPILDAKKQKTVSAEALVRWKHPEKGLISPGLFIPVFEKNGFITKLDMYVCEEVCRHQHEEMEKGHEIVPVSVNLSRINFYNENLYQEILNLLKKYELTSNNIKLEITESAYKDNPEDLIIAIDTLQKYGFKVLMDDFGSGYSSLNMLKDCCVDILKIDMKFMDNLENSDRASNIMFNIIQMAKTLNMETVVEGVETQNQYEMLKSMGVDTIQGYYFSKPITEMEFTERLQNEADAKSDYALEEKRDTILVVDDMEIGRVSVSEVIKDKYNIIEAHNGVQALELLKKHFTDISLVISDINMPEMSGLDMLENMRKISFLCNIPVLIVTAYGEYENESRALELGALEVINKPFDPAILRKRIENLLKLSSREQMEKEIYSLRETSVIRKQIQDMMTGSATGICRSAVSYDNLEPQKVLFVNESFEKMHRNIRFCGVDMQRYREDLDAIIGADLASIKTLLKDAIAHKRRSMQAGYRIKWKDGNLRYILANYSFFYTSDYVIVDIVEIEYSIEDEVYIQKSAEPLIKQIVLSFDLVIWRYDIKNDMVELFLKNEYGNVFHRMYSNGMESCINDKVFFDDDRPRVKQLFERLKNGEKKVVEEFYVHDFANKDNYKWIRLTCRGNDNDDGSDEFAMGVCEDITNQKLIMEQSWRKIHYKEILKRDSYIFAEFDLTCNCLVYDENKMWEMNALGIEGEAYDKIVDERLLSHIDRDEKEYCMSMLDRNNLLKWFEEGEDEIRFDYQSDEKNGIFEWYTAIIYLYKNANDNHIYAGLQIKNIQEERGKLSRMKKLAEQDALTGIANRIVLEKNISDVFSDVKRRKKLSAFVMVDVDNFKAVNDNFGHDVGDTVLKAIANVLLETFRKDDIVARIGGDEFAVFITGASSIKAICNRVDELCKKAYMKFDNQGKDIYISCSCGVAFAPECGNDFQSLYTSADQALYKAKTSGKNRVCIYAKDK